MSDVTIEHLASNPELVGQYRARDVVYSTARGAELTLTVIYPWAADKADGFDAASALPLVVFVQGSGWLTPDRGFELPQLCELARHGYVVATVGHRNCVADEAPLPAALIDVKCAIMA